MPNTVYAVGGLLPGNIAVPLEFNPGDSSLDGDIVYQHLRTPAQRLMASRLAALVCGTRTPDLVFEVGGERLPSTTDVRELARAVDRAGVRQIGTRYTDE